MVFASPGGLCRLHISRHSPSLKAPAPPASAQWFTAVFPPVKPVWVGMKSVWILVAQRGGADERGEGVLTHEGHQPRVSKRRWSALRERAPSFQPPEIEVACCTYFAVSVRAARAHRTLPLWSVLPEQPRLSASPKTALTEKGPLGGTHGCFVRIGGQISAPRAPRVRCSPFRAGRLTAAAQTALCILHWNQRFQLAYGVLKRYCSLRPNHS